MNNFIDIPTEAGPVILGVAQIASIEAGGKRAQHAIVRLGNGAQFTALMSVDAVLDLIEEATAPAPVEVVGEKEVAAVASAQGVPPPAEPAPGFKRATAKRRAK